MSEHKPAIESWVVEEWAHRGGCELCGWRGPWRDVVELAQADAQQHMIDVERYAEIGTHG